MSENRPTTDEVIAEDTTFEMSFMANLPPRLTGLPMVVWVQERDAAAEGPAIKVSLSPGRKTTPGNTATVTVCPRLRVIPGTLSAADRQAVSDWIRLNEGLILDYWFRRISAIELFDRIRRLP